MKRIEFICGVGHKANGEKLDDVFSRTEAVRLLLRQTYGAFTEFQTVGEWADSDGRPVRENGLAWVVIAYGGAMEIAGRIANLMAQDCVAVNVSEVNFSLVGPTDD